MRRPDTDTVYGIIDALIDGQSVKIIAKKFKLTETGVRVKLNHYSDVADFRFQKQKPGLYAKILLELVSDKRPNKIALRHELEPCIVFALDRIRKERKNETTLLT